MIKLNLLPSDLRKRHRTLTTLQLSVVTRLPIFKICLYVAGGLLILHSLLFLILVWWSFSLKGVKSRWEAIAEKRQMVSELTKRHAELSAKEKNLQQLTSRRPLWSKKLKGLSESMVSGVWLRVFSLEERTVSVPSPAQKAATGSRKALILEGTAASLRGDQLAIIGRFIRGLKQNPNFSFEFQEVELESTHTRKIQDIEVMDFKIICLLREGSVP